MVEIRGLRIGFGLKQEELAERARVKLTKLKRWERGLELPPREAVDRIAEVFGVDPSHLMRDQAAYADKVIPGEGYTTAKASNTEVFQRKMSVPKQKLRVLDLFCGCGGLSWGLEQSGAFVTTCGIDLLRDRVMTFSANHDCAIGIAADIREISLSRMAEMSGGFDIIIGGPPCQGFSSIRPFRKLTEHDKRNSLIESFVFAVGHLKPSWFVFENVVGILTHQKGRVLRTLLEGFDAAGYSVDWRVLNAALYGVPQFRERLVIVGNKTGCQFSWPDPTHEVQYRSMAGQRSRILKALPLFSSRLDPAIPLMKAIDDLPALGAGEEATAYQRDENLSEYQQEMRWGSDKLTLHKATRHSTHMLEIIKNAGSNISALPPGMVNSGFSSCYSRLDPSLPSTTITVNFVHPSSNRCIHPFQDRALTPREGARIQSFPDRFWFRGTRAQIVKQIGNAVPPKLGFALGRAIIESIRPTETAKEPYRLSAIAATKDA